jgi:hypothetical protein
MTDFGAKKPKVSPYKAALAKLVKMGYKIDSKESTPGAHKTWLVGHPRQLAGFANIVDAFPEGRLDSAGQELYFQWGYMADAGDDELGGGKTGVFVQAYRKGSAGEESRMGINT